MTLLASTLLSLKPLRSSSLLYSKAFVWRLKKYFWFQLKLCSFRTNNLFSSRLSSIYCFNPQVLTLSFILSLSLSHTHTHAFSLPLSHTVWSDCAIFKRSLRQIFLQKWPKRGKLFGTLLKTHNLFCKNFSGSTFWANFRELGYFSSNIWSHCSRTLTHFSHSLLPFHILHFNIFGLFEKYFLCPHLARLISVLQSSEGPSKVFVFEQQSDSQQSNLILNSGSL